jgi:hypothetical protein
MLMIQRFERERSSCKSLVEKEAVLYDSLSFAKKGKNFYEESNNSTAILLGSPPRLACLLMDN